MIVAEYSIPQVCLVQILLNTAEVGVTQGRSPLGQADCTMASLGLAEDHSNSAWPSWVSLDHRITAVGTELSIDCSRLESL